MFFGCLFVCSFVSLFVFVAGGGRWLVVVVVMVVVVVVLVAVVVVVVLEVKNLEKDEKECLRLGVMRP